MPKFKVKNLHPHTPIGVHCADGSVATIECGEEVELDLSDAEASDFIQNKNSPLKLVKVGAAKSKDVEVKDGKKGKGEAAAAG